MIPKVILLSGLFALSFATIPLWVQQSIEFQRSITNSSTIDLIAPPCSHNAYNHPGNLPPLIVRYQNLQLLKGKVILENQKHNMTTQMEMGIRHLQIDAHYIPEYDQVYLCHGAAEALDLCPIVEGISGTTCEQAVGFVDLGVHTGCTRDADLWTTGLNEIAAFINKTRNDFFIIEIEVQSDPSNYTRVFQPVQDILGSFALTQAQLDTFRTTTQKKWPTFKELQDLGRNIIIISDRAYPESNGYVLDNEPAFRYPDNQAKYFSLNNCSTTNNPSVSGNSFTIFGESDIRAIFDLFGYSSNEDGHVTVGEINYETAKNMMGCGFGTCLDLIDESDMRSYVWSWAEGKSNIACVSSTCPIANISGWSYDNCSGQKYFACNNNTDPNQWTLSSQTGAFANTPSCPPGFSFNFPKNPTENKNLNSLITNLNIQGGVWINPSYRLDTSNGVCSEVYVAPNSANSIFANNVFVFIISLLLCSLLF